MSEVSVDDLSTATLEQQLESAMRSDTDAYSVEPRALLEILNGSRRAHVAQMVTYRETALVTKNAGHAEEANRIFGEAIKVLGLIKGFDARIAEVKAQIESSKS